ncbi:MAG TPA: hypothetical protein VIL22_05750 [Paenibacillaceae bacterium]
MKPGERGNRTRAEAVLLAPLWGATAGFCLLLIAMAWPEYWRYVAPETSPLAWWESVLLALSSFACLLLAWDAWRREERRAVRAGWLAVAAGFALLALDERFAVHERIRDRFLKPTGIRLLPWMEEGDWLIPLYALAGLAAAWGIWRLLGVRPASRRFFAAALVMAFCGAALDTVDIRSLDPAAERLLQSVEEIVEALAMTAFLSAFLLALAARLGDARTDVH